jgi:nucleoside-diphosphate-sugar epimerase
MAAPRDVPSVGPERNNEEKTMHVLLAGATGVVGRRIVPLLVADGHRVTGLTRRPDRAAALRALGAEPAVVDVLEGAAVTAAVRAAAPDVVMHQLTDLSGADLAANARLRVVGTRALVDAARAAGVRRIVAQSIAFAYVDGPDPATEDVPLDPARAGVGELESAVAELPEWVVLRYGMFYGPGTWFAADARMADQARAGELVADESVTSFVHVDDAATAAVAALGWPTGAVNVCDDEPAAGRDWVPAFCAAVGTPSPPAATSRVAGARGADNRRARRLGWTPRYPSWRNGFAALVPAH